MKNIYFKKCICSCHETIKNGGIITKHIVACCNNGLVQLENPTAKDVLEKHWKLKTDFPMDDVIKLNMQYCVDSMEEYAKLKCQKLLEIVVRKASVYADEGGYSEFVDENSILNAVDLESFCK